MKQRARNHREQREKDSISQIVRRHGLLFSTVDPLIFLTVQYPDSPLNGHLLLPSSYQDDPDPVLALGAIALGAGYIKNGCN